MLGENLLIKLWDSIVDKGIGGLLTPWQILREEGARAEARKREKLLLAKAENEAENIRNGNIHILPSSKNNNALLFSSSTKIEPLFDAQIILEQANTREQSDKIMGEININKAVIYAEEELINNDRDFSNDDSVNDDWLFRWKENVSKVTAEELQFIWGKVLAGEIRSPGQYSLRTLDFLKNLSKDEANLIEKVAQYNISGNIHFSKNAITEDNDAFFEKNDLLFSDFMVLQELGILNGVTSTFGLKRILRSDIEDTFQKVLISYKKALLITHNDPDKEILTPSYTLTQLGKEVLSLGSFKDNDEYLKIVGKRLLDEGVKVSFGEWNQLNDRHGEFSLIEEIIESNQE